MAIIISPNFSLPNDPTIDDNSPILAYQNIVTSSNIAASSATPDRPVTNLANPATQLKWQGLTADQYSKLLLHFDGSDAATTFTDDSGESHTVTAVGNAQLDTAQQVFGTAAGLFDGTGDYLTLDGSSDFAFGSSDFTIEFRFRLATINAQYDLYDSRPASTNGLYPYIYITSGNLLRYHVDSADRISGTTELAVDTWYSLVISRREGVTRMFLDGAQEGSSYADSNAYLNGTSRPTIAAGGNSAGSNALDGWIDELHVSNGIARYWEAFTVPTEAYHTGDLYLTITTNTTDELDYIAIASHNLGSGAVPISIEGDTGSGFTEILADALLESGDGPTLLQFASDVYTSLRIRLQAGNEQPCIGVVYCGATLRLQRRVYVGHTPIDYGRNTRVLSGISESGNFLGRRILSDTVSTRVDFDHITAGWYRDNLEPWVINARQEPFFFAWRPQTYPNEVGYAWLLGDVSMVNQHHCGTVQVGFDISGVA